MHEALDSLPMTTKMEKKRKKKNPSTSKLGIG
jgi:hypothetical protein